MSMRSAMTADADGRGHVHDSFDELGLLAMGHGIVAALELRATEPIPVFQWHDLAILGNHEHLFLHGLGHGVLPKSSLGMIVPKIAAGCKLGWSMFMACAAPVANAEWTRQQAAGRSPWRPDGNPMGRRDWQATAH